MKERRKKSQPLRRSPIVKLAALLADPNTTLAGIEVFIPVETAQPFKVVAAEQLLDSGKHRMIVPDR